MTPKSPTAPQPTTETKKVKTRSPEHQAASVAIELAKLDAAILRAEETVTEKKSERTRLITGLADPIAVLVKRMRGEPTA